MSPRCSFAVLSSPNITSSPWEQGLIIHRGSPRAYNGAWHTHAMTEKTRQRPDTGTRRGSSVSRWAAAASELWALRSCPPPGPSSTPSARARGPGAEAAPPYPCPLPFLRLVAPHPRAGTCRPPGRGGPAHSASLGRRCPSDHGTR